MASKRRKPKPAKTKKKTRIAEPEKKKRLAVKKAAKKNAKKLPKTPKRSPSKKSKAKTSTGRKKPKEKRVPKSTPKKGYWTRKAVANRKKFLKLGKQKKHTEKQFQWLLSHTKYDKNGQPMYAKHGTMLRHLGEQTEAIYERLAAVTGDKEAFEETVNILAEEFEVHRSEIYTLIMSP